VISGDDCVFDLILTPRTPLPRTLVGRVAERVAYLILDDWASAFDEYRILEDEQRVDRSPVELDLQIKDEYEHATKSPLDMR